MQWNKLTLAFSAALLASGCSYGNSAQGAPPESAGPALSLPQQQRDSIWFTGGQRDVQDARAQVVNNNRGAARNIILFVGDGMGISTVTAARILAGQQQGLDGEEYQLSFEKMPFSGLLKTYNTNQQTPDSAGTMTALITGVKTKAGMISVAGDLARGDCAASLDHKLVTALELAEAQGKSTGIISTARITHATPAATYAKVPERNWEYRAPEGCEDIAAQMVGLSVGDGIDLILGGGRRSFLPRDITDLEGSSGKRGDGRNLVTEWKDRYRDSIANAAYVEDRSGFDALDIAATDKLFGLFNSSHMHYEVDRRNDAAGEPSLSQMTARGLDLLKKNADGYFLMVESGRIDHGHHAGSAYNALNDAVEFARAIEVAMANTSAEDTLIIVTADHSHVMTIAGYPTRGNPILGKVVLNDDRGEPQADPALAADGLPFTTIGYASGRGYADLGEETDGDVRYDKAINAGRKDLSRVETTVPGYHQEALVPLDAETHGGEDVGVWARGPGAHLLTGTHEQSFVFHVMAHAGGLLAD